MSKERVAKINVGFAVGLFSLKNVILMLNQHKEDEICLEYAIQTGGFIVTNDKFRIISSITGMLNTIMMISV